MKVFKNIITKAKKSAKEIAIKVSIFITVQKYNMHRAVSNNRGENYVDSGIKILIAVVLGGLLLAGLYALFGDMVIPTLKTKIQEMFNYKG